MNKEKFASKAWEATVRRSQAALALTKRSSGGGFCGTMPVAHVDDEDIGIAPSVSSSSTSNSTRSSTSSPEIYHSEKALTNGDYYTGQWVENMPHGMGRYIWNDGCVYVGEWYKGKTMGKGKFCWPSGACYEGDFKNGYMDGKGTYIGSNGDLYRGFWVMNLKHGQGTKHFANGDCYEGEWRRGAQDGQGRYQWKNGNRYVGQWKNGVIHGNGALVWANGNCYEGCWEDGMPKGNGTFRWADGSYYVGIWSKDPIEQNGTYYPVGLSPHGNLDWDPQKVFWEDLIDCKICPGEKATMIMPSQKTPYCSGIEGDLMMQLLPAGKVGDGGRRLRRSSVDGRLNNGPDKICIWGSDGDITCDIVDGNSMVGREEDDGFNGLQVEDVDLRGPQLNLMRMQQREMKKQGETISKGHKNYELMLNLQLGIRHSVARPAPATSLDLKHSAFDPKEKVWTRFPPEGSKHTPPHQSCEFKWKDYCPLVFRTLRKLFKVDAADYMLSICGNDALRELSSPGKSGSFFYLTNDDRYMIKTIKKTEVKVLLKMLRPYYKHVRSFENTLVTKFFGLHCVKLTGAIQRKVRFVIMGNLFCSEYTIHRRYDLKGSSHGRTTDKPEAEIDANTTLKDLDLNFIFRLQRSWFQEFQRQVDRDCEFLETERIMDYSLLVGVHFRESSYTRDHLVTEGRPSCARTPRSNGNSEGEQQVSHLSPVDMDQFFNDPTRWATIKLGVNMPARVEQMLRRSNCDSQMLGDPTGEYYEVILFFGIIDILQNYDITKKLEHAYKSIHYDATSISAVDPKQYSRRFRDFIFRVFAEDT